MAIIAAIMCDKCGYIRSWDHVGKTNIIRWSRKDGWTIGKQCLCPKCSKKKIN